MRNVQNTCPDCRTPLKPLLLSDIIGDEVEKEDEACVASAKAMFKVFRFKVCTICGRTSMFVGKEARERAGG
jgi:hypothetical protein